MEAESLLDRQFIVKESPFFFDPSGELTRSHYNEILGVPAVPVVGRYYGGEYILGKILFILTLPCRIVNNKCFYQEEQLHLPPKILELLQNIPELIPHNRPPKSEKKQTKKGKTEEEEGPATLEYHPESFELKQNFTFRFVVSTHDSKKEPQQFLNYVCHNYIFQKVDFLTTKKHVSYVPLCIVPGLDSGILEWTKDYKGICRDHLRSQYTSFHLKKGAPAFSPNNMKIGIPPDANNFLNFYTLLLTQDEYCVNYHWHFMDYNNPIEKIISNSSSLRELMNKYQDIYGKDGALLELRKIFINGQ